MDTDEHGSGAWAVLPPAVLAVPPRREGLPAMRRVLTILIRIYQCTISPLLGPCCRFYPSCSQYCLEAVQVHGCLRGLLLGIKRILKCHPFHPGGVDPVPDRRSRETAQGARTNAGPETVNTAENGTNGHG